MPVPSKIPHGLNFKKAVLGTINALIDYLNGNWLQGGPGISIKRTPSGTIIGLAKPKDSARQVASASGSGVNQDLSVAVSGNTATIGLSGSTSSVELVGVGDVGISGGTNGRVEINVTGGTGSRVLFPSYTTPLVQRGAVQPSVTYPGTAYADQPVWLIGNLTAVPNSSGEVILAVVVYISNGGNQESVYLSDFSTQPGSYLDKVQLPVCLPIPAGHSFQINVMQNSSPDTTDELAIYPCI